MEEEKVKELDRQLYTCLLSLTDNDSFDIVVGSNKSGLEAWRKLHKRRETVPGLYNAFNVVQSEGVTVQRKMLRDGATLAGDVMVRCDTQSVREPGAGSDGKDTRAAGDARVAAF